MKGTPAELYLHKRGLSVPDSPDMRYEARAWHWKARQHAPAILCRVTDFVTGEPLTVHQTFITEDGQKSPLIPRRLMLPSHQKQGGIIRLTSDEQVTVGLSLAEGMETALAVMAAGWCPVWAAIDAGNLADLPVLDGIEALTVFADHDDAGLRAAEKLAQRWVRAGREVAIATPSAFGKDWADDNA